MDIGLTFDAATMTADLQAAGADLALDDSLQTAVVISLSTNRRAAPDDLLPDDVPGRPGTGDRRSWCGDWYGADGLAATQAGVGVLPAPTDRIGSRRGPARHRPGDPD